MDTKKSLIALALVALVGIVGGTYAYFTSSAKLTNEFTTGTYATSVTEEFVSPTNWAPGQKVDKKVNVTNNGTVDIAVRASYTETWKAANGTTLSNTMDGGESIAVFAVGADWEKATDGKYYYKSTLAPNGTTTNFITDVTFNPDYEFGDTDMTCTTTSEGGVTEVKCENTNTGYAGATYTLDITIETIQADQKWTYTAA